MKEKEKGRRWVELGDLVGVGYVSNNLDHHGRIQTSF